MASRLPTDADMSEKLIFLAETDEQWAIASARFKATEERLKVVRSQEYLNADGKSIATREAQALTSPEYVKLLEVLESSLTQKLLLTAQRKRAELVIDVWRSLNANKRRSTEQTL